MTYIKTGIKLPGIIELLYYKASTGKALADLSHTLLRGPSGLTAGEREVIASYVSNLNECEFCHNTHSASAATHLNDGGNTISCVIANLDTSPLSDKMKSLLKIAAKTAKSGRDVRPEDIEE